MDTEDENVARFQKEDHQVAYIFKPSKGDGQPSNRPSKRRRTSREVAHVAEDATLLREPSMFVPLLGGNEPPECVALREKLFESSWAPVEARIKGILRDANSATLDKVTAFVQDETSSPKDKLPAAFIVTGANIASQGMLFEQLADRLQASTRSKFVRLRSSDAPNIKATLKKVIQDATSRGGLDEDDAELSFGQDDRKYLNYDLEGLHAFVQATACEHVFVAFEDSEGFDSALLSDLMVLFHSWIPRIPFTLLFGVATSVELLQARLLKSACHLVYGAQFDVVQTEAILEQVFVPAVAGADVALRLGPGLLQAFVDRQHHEVAGIQLFVSSLKYAYMCHFYGNPLSAFMVADDAMNSELVRSEHMEIFRNLPSFRRMVENAVDDGRLQFARSAIEDDEFLTEMIFDIPKRQEEWAAQTLRALSLLRSLGVTQQSFAQMYIRALSDGVDLSPGGFDVLPNIKRQLPEDFAQMLQRLADAITSGDEGLDLSPQSRDTSQQQHILSIQGLIKETRELQQAADGKGNALRSAYGGQSRALRTTVVAQKVQLSRDSAALSDEDKGFTSVVDRAVELLFEIIRSEPATSVALHEAWLYDARSPHREVLVPRPRQVFERSLLRPYDYLACSCCKADGDGISTTLPVTSLLYHLYLEAGSIINVADLWAAFFAMVGAAEEGEGEGDEGGGHDERTALVLFYKGLAELKSLGFVKASRKKTDHIAKLKWL